MDWGQAQAYCRAQGKRLPSEWEWVWAALGGTDPGSPDNEAPPHPTRAGKTTEDRRHLRRGQTAPGNIEDLDGNVSEWTSSRQPWGGTWPVGRLGRQQDRLPDVLTYWHNDVLAGYPTRNEYSRALRRDDLRFRCAR